jgi:hypothetical protein
VHETHRESRKRKVRGVLLKVGLVSTTAVAALAFASAARGEDQPAPPPLPLEKSALIAPEEADVEDDGVVVAPTDVVPSTQETVDVAQPSSQKKHANLPSERRARPVRARVVTARDPRRPVISVSRAAGRAVPRHVAVKPAAHRALRSAGEWYQVVPSQYRPVEHKVRPWRPTHVKRVEEPVVVGAVTTARSEPRTAPIICASLVEKCLELCGSDVVYNSSWNGSAIWYCISAPKVRVALERLHQIIAEGLHEASASARATAPQPRYQCEWAQYHAGICADGAHVAVSMASGADAAAGSQPARFVAPDTPVGTQSVTDKSRPKRLGSVLGAAVPRTHAEPAIKVRAPLTRLTGPHSRRAAVAGPPPAATADKPFDDEFLRSLLVLMGIATVGVLLAILFELEGAGRAVTTLRSRIGSRGLSPTRIALGGRSRRPDRIHYRE